MKRQLKLDLDQLEVESFGTTSEPADRSGTVFGMITGACNESPQGFCSGEASCPALCSTDCPAQTIPCTVPSLTCPPPSQQTCATGCYSGCQTCMSCQDTCWQTCSVDVCGTCDFKTQCWQ